jgi:subtilisin family serine protease
LIAGLLAGLLTIAPAGPAGANPPDSTITDHVVAQPADASRTVTLITGDRVTVTDEGGLALHRGEGRDHITFLAQRAGEHQYVIPSDAVPLLAAGRLDRRLFDVTLLHEFGYHDERPDLPLIVTYDQTAAAAAVIDAGARVVRTLPVVDGAAVEVDRAGVGEFWGDLTGGAAEAATLAAGVSTVWLDGLRQPSLDESVPQVGAPAAWDVGLDGTGVTVAVLDTGIDATHPDLADRVVGQRNFTEGVEDDRDRVGHGTHVASTVAGEGTASDGQFRGVAPGAQLLDGKVCAEFGCAESWLLAGMQWAAEQGASVVNMSLGGADLPGLDPVEQAVETLTAEFGLLFVIAAGNAGFDQSISSPASTDAALAVGAVDKSDELAFFSSRGPRIDGALKPDLTAPGVDITAANSKDGFIGQPGQAYATISGTSMATPHVAGAAAILAQQHPDWSPEQLKAALMGSAAPHPELGPYAQGAGRLDVARAITQSVTSDPASVSFDRPLWPHDDDDPQVRTISYRNDGAADVTLTLELATVGPAGEPAPDGFFTLESSTVTVPSGGSAEIEIVADTAVGELDGYFGGQLVATGPGLVVTTPFAVDREVESYDVTLSHLDRSGAPTGDHFTTLARLDQPRFADAFGEPETTVRVPAAEYLLASQLFEEADDGSFEVTMLVQPRLTVDRDLTLTLDAREGERVSVGVPDPQAVHLYTLADALFVVDNIFAGFTVAAFDQERVFTAQIGESAPLPGLASMVIAAHVVPAAGGGEARETAYHQAYIFDEEFFTGFDRTPKRRELARVKTDYAVQVAGSELTKTVVPLRLDPPAGGIGVGLPLDAPAARTEFYSTGDALEWLNIVDELLFTEESVEDIIVLDGGLTSYQAGRTYVERWNYGAFGPVLPDEFSGVRRFGDQLTVAPVLYGDGAGHWGSSPATGAITVFRHGEPIAEVAGLFASIEVPPEPAAYRVEVEAERLGPAPLSRRTSLAWEFESGHVAGEVEQQLAVPVVRFSPNLRPDNTAPAGRLFLVPVSVDQPPAADAGRVASLTVEVSFDDGETWREVPVFARAFALVKHPTGDGFVSFRATATDTEGNAVAETIVRAYQIS